MPYCSECGVELDHSVRNCPLCRSPVYHSQRLPDSEQNYAESDDIEDMVAQRPSGYGRRLAVQIMTVICTTPLLVSVVADLLLNGGLTWSLYVGVSMIAVWVYSAVPLLLYRRLLPILTVCIVMTGFLMWAVDLLDSRVSWFWSIGLPIMASLLVITGVVTAVALLSRRRGANTVAFVLLGVIAFCMSLDVITAGFIMQDRLFSWSLMVGAALLPLVIFLFYFHHFLSRRINLKKKFFL